MVTGSCLCGVVQYRITCEPGKIQICHCSQCRKGQGSAFASNIPIDKNHFEITEGLKALKSFESPTRGGKCRVFCSECGSPVFSRLDSAPDIVRVRAGLLDVPVPLEVAHHQFVLDKADWFEISDDAPQFDAFPPK